MDGATEKVVGIVGDDPLTSRVLGVLLEGAGYEVRTMEAAAVLENPSAWLGGVDLVLCSPPLGGEHGEELLGAMKRTSECAQVPALRLSTEAKAERTDSVLPWPWPTEALVGAIEQALHAPGDDKAS